MFDPSSEDEQIIEGMIGQMVQTTQRASKAIDEALAYVEASNRRIDAMERQARVAGRPAA